MTSVDATASGFPYRVVTVGGHPAISLEPFVGQTSFVVSKSGAESTIVGVGSLDEGAVRFFEKGVTDGKDVRVWRIRQTDEGTCTAETLSV